MRLLALGAILGACFFAAAADAREYRDPTGRLVFDAPANWPVTVERSAPEVTYVIAGNDDNECRFLVSPNANTSGRPAYDVWRTVRGDAQFTPEWWTSTANGFGPLFANNSASFVSRSRDDAGFWPVQRAELDSGSRNVRVYAGLQLRPGWDIAGYCVNYDGEPPVARFDQVLRSMGQPNDAELRASAQAQVDAALAAEAAAAAAPAAPAPQ